MFASQQPMRLSTEFPPKDRTEPILAEGVTEPPQAGMSEFELEPEMMEESTMGRRTGAQAHRNQPNFPVPKLDIPLFDGENPRWWIRRCERMFTLYQVQE